MQLTMKSVGVGIIIGLFAVFLAYMGNPANMAICVACFIRDIAGSLGLHRAEAVQYARPEMIGLVVGALAMSLLGKEFSVKGGSSPITRFILGMCVMVGALIFLGCPLRMVLRIAGGDLNAVIGLFGFVGGILAGIFFLNRGFTLNRNYTLPKVEGFAFPFLTILLLVALVIFPGLLLFSTKGPGATHAPIWASLIAGLGIGAVAQKMRVCFVSGIRDAFLVRDFYMTFCLLALTATVFVGNLAMNKFNLGFANQPIAHTEMLWNILGLGLVGFGSVLLGGCPLRQVVAASSGNVDSVVTVLGYLVGAALVHNFGLASSAAGVTVNGKIAFALCLAVMLVIAIISRSRKTV